MRSGKGCSELLSEMLSRGFFPLSYHLNNNNEREQHFKATAIWSFSAPFIALAIALYVIGLQNAHDAEHDWYDNLDDSLHRFAAFVTLAAINVLVAGIPALLYRRFQDKRNEPDHAPLIGTNVGDFETSTRLWYENEDRPKTNEFGELVSCHYIRCFRPMTPLKLFLWGLFIGGAATTVIMSAVDNSFEKLSTSEFAHYGGILTGAVLGAGALSASFTLFHKLGAKIHDCVDVNGAARRDTTDITFL